PAVRRAVDVEASADHAHVEHWPDPEFFVTPAIGVHRTKIAESQVGRSVETSGKCFSEKSEAAAQGRASIPGGLLVSRQKLVLSTRSAVRVPHFETPFILEIEVAFEIYNRTGNSTSRKAGLARRN